MIKTKNKKKVTGVLCVLCALLIAIASLFLTGIKPLGAKAEDDAASTENNAFDGYQENAVYDADENYFLTRPEVSAYQGHKEAATVGFITTFAENGWAQETGYTLYTTPAKKGDLVVLQFVHPIDATKIGGIKLGVFSNVPRTLEVYNAYEITENSLGESLQSVVLPGRESPAFTNLTLKCDEYADENGMLDTIVFQVTNEGSANVVDNSIYFGSFTCLPLDAVKFDGYEEGVVYDAEEKFFYTRLADSDYKGHKEAATVGFTKTFEENGWAQESGYTLYTEIAEKGDLIVLQFVHPIDATKIGGIKISIFSNVPRTLEVYNAYTVTEDSLGESLQRVVLPGRESPAFTNVTLASELYADEKGKVDTIVFQVTNDGSEVVEDNGIYFGSFTCLPLEAVQFNGYEEGVVYDAEEKFFYTRLSGYDYKGHKEATTVGFTKTFEENGWVEETGYTLYTEIAEKGDLVVLEFVHPINAAEFGAIELNMFSNVPRSFVTHNAYEITEESLGETLQSFSLPGRSSPTFTKITLLSELYADENGIVDTVVFQVTDDGSAEVVEDNGVYFGSFACSPLKLKGLVYDDSFFIVEQEDCYDLTFRFNAKGEFTGKESLDFTKVRINGESLEEINRGGNYATARWAAVQGIYQINVTLSKAYPGVGAIKNADINFVGNNMQVEKGLLMPNGEILDRNYTCHIYHNERMVSYEMIDHYEETRVAQVSVRLDPDPNHPENDPNIHFIIVFDKPITSQVYYHASQTEAWRQVSLTTMANMYNENISAAYIAGGFKAALFDNVYVNGKNIGEWQALDSIPTATLVHVGQLSEYTLDFSIDCRADMFKPLFDAINEGNGTITLEIKAGMKFTTGIKTTEDFSCTISGLTVRTEGDAFEPKVFYDGKRVDDGDLILSATKAAEQNIYVDGGESYTVKTSVNGNVVSFVITFANGEIFSFGVKEDIVNDIPEVEEEEGCSSSLSIGGVAALAIAVLAALGLRRKSHE